MPTLVFAGVLASGEASLSRCTERLDEQTVPVERFLVHGLPYRAAHRRLFRMLGRRTDCDIKLKCDADMIISSITFTEVALEFFRRHLSISHVVLPVHDFMTAGPIEGLHVWRGDVRWKRAVPSLFTDRVESTSARVLRLLDVPTVATHAESADMEEVLRFAVRRLAKAAAVGDPSSAYWERLEDFTRASMAHPTPERLLACRVIGNLVVVDRWPDEQLRRAQTRTGTPFVEFVESLLNSSRGPAIGPDGALRTLQDMAARRAVISRYRSSRESRQGRRGRRFATSTLRRARRRSFESSIQGGEYSELRASWLECVESVG